MSETTHHRARTVGFGALVRATTARVLGQLRHDHRTVGMLLGVPILLITLLFFMFDGGPVFDHVVLVMLGIFPFIIMFLVTAIAMLRERSTGTLERLMATSAGPLDLLSGYGIAFGLAAAVQSLVVVGVTSWLYGVDTQAGIGWAVLVAVLTALLGVGLGLLSSAFARTEFQAVQMLPVVVFPQLLLCGLFVPREAMPEWLRIISDFMPLSYAVDGMQQVGMHPEPTGEFWRDIAVVTGCVVLAAVLAASTMRRSTR